MCEYSNKLEYLICAYLTKIKKFSKSPCFIGEISDSPELYIVTGEIQVPEERTGTKNEKQNIT